MASSPLNVTILDDWHNSLSGLPCFAKLAGLEVTVHTDHVQHEDALAERLADTDVLVLFRERTTISGSLLDRLPRLKLISQRSVYPHVDVEGCTRNGVILSSNMHSDTPSYAAAELTWGLILASYRQLIPQYGSLKTGQWQMGVGRTLRGRTLGLYGYGRIAKVVDGYAKAFGLNTVWWGSERGRERAQADGAAVASSRKAFFAEPDIISLHVRLKPATRGLITAQDLGHMREDALLVNTSRAGLIEEGALLTALNKGRPGSAALDVFDTEPITQANDPLACHEQVTASPHIGFVTLDEYELQFSDIFDQVVAFANGEPIHVQNPEVLG